MTFVRSGELFSTYYFSPDWDLESIQNDVVLRTGKTPETARREVNMIVATLLKNGVVVNELC